MPRRLLLTSFSTWRADQRSNSSDDLIELLPQDTWDTATPLLRLLPVDVAQATERAIAYIHAFTPDVVVCCGMAEGRSRLHLERQAVQADRTLQTPIDLEQLCQALPMTEISHDAGQFVCNGYYFALLDYLAQAHQPTQALFVHVPVLTPENRTLLVQDFTAVLNRLQQ
ncbi:MAG: peptidase C15 [Kaiparowitsia implicata GSE-PSE-MK54-09C]|jgi:pyroglutamyl-peptidase|nr:peptidase C15 [Kaiparowitsia implicata GSE-PSE-MK54-09C]